MTEVAQAPAAAPAPQLTPQERLDNSVKENLHDEHAIKLMNAQLLVKRDSMKDVEGYDHAFEVFQKELEIMSGCSIHIAEQITVVKENMRSKFLAEAASSKNPRDVLIDTANVGVEGLAQMFSDMEWINEQTAHFQTVIDEQFSDNILKKGAKAVKKLAFAPVTLTAWGVDKLVRAATLGRKGLTKKEKKVS